ncbi:MAG: tetratricopeptide repeat protein [Candidatus Eisenbacteria bacterium]|uniref:Tetratricopeptide repeat protein n=1 Tax=Eiseniibacteriota bacterium TaxID=2212470 RepID=A0A948RUZ1_UNCEI|nr:tetratricopeptide repeat protein [Candidatus Eisenbacteria bacterium]MBU1948749.1 tetratricopeptide repeat protein [Candidatus Eisenbacteria bacterium]MBU2690466.1 tetratricopeptide repeat protein [Candidatus Eisenbacteria bacterium]
MHRRFPANLSATFLMAVLCLAANILAYWPLPGAAKSNYSANFSENELYQLPVPPQLFNPPDLNDFTAPTPNTLTGVAGLTLLESDALPPAPGFLSPTWGWDLSLRREQELYPTLSLLFDGEAESERLPFSRGEHFLRAETALHLENWEKAAELFREFIQHYPSDTLIMTAEICRAEALFRSQEPVAAAEGFERVFRQAEDARLRWIAGRSLAWIQRMEGDTTAARTVLEFLLTSDSPASLADPSMAPMMEDAIRLDLGELELAGNRPEEACRVLEPWSRDAAISAPSARDPRGFYILGIASLSLEDWPQAMSAFNALLRTQAPPPSVWIAKGHAVLGWLHLREGDLDQAKLHYESAALIPAEGEARDIYGMALAMYRQGDLSGALQLLNGNEAPLPEDLQWSWSYTRGFIYFQLGQYQDVFSALDLSLQRHHPDSLQLQALLLLGDARRRLDQNQEALASYRQAALLVKDPPEDLLWRWAVTALDLQRWGEGTRVLGDLQKRFPGSSRQPEAAFWKAEAYYRLGRFQEAEDSYGMALRTGFNKAAAQYGLGWCAYVKGRFREAADYFGAAIAAGLASPQSVDAAIRRGHSLSNLREWDAAWDSYEAAARMGAGTPMEDEARFRQGRLLLRRDRPAEAARLWEGLAASSDQRTIAALSAYWAGAAWFAASQFGDAERMFRDASQRIVLSDSLRTAADLGAADALYNGGNQDQALDDYRSLLQKDKAPIAIRAAAADGVYNILVLRKKWDEAARFIDDVLQTFPELSRLGERHLRIADGYLEEGMLEKAASAYKALLARDDLIPALQARSHIGSARTQERLGHGSQAAYHWEAAGRLSDPAHRGKLWLDAAGLYLKAGQPREVVRLLEELRGLEIPVADRWRVSFLLAQAYEGLERLEPAVTAWQETVDTAPTDTVRIQSLARIGYLQFQLKNWPESIAAYQRADSAGALAKPFRSLYWIGESFFQMERWDEAQEVLSRFLKNPPEEALWEAMARLRRADALEKLERWDAALEEYDRVLTLNVGDAIREEAGIRRRQVQTWSGAPKNEKRDVKDGSQNDSP